MNDEHEIYDLGLRIKQLRKLNKLTQTELAKRIGISKGTVYKYEQNTQTPTLEKAKKLARILNVSTDYLLGLDDELNFKINGLSEAQRNILWDLINEFTNEKNDC